MLASLCVSFCCFVVVVFMAREEKRGTSSCSGSLFGFVCFWVVVVLRFVPGVVTSDVKSII